MTPRGVRRGCRLVARERPALSWRPGSGASLSFAAVLSMWRAGIAQSEDDASNRWRIRTQSRSGPRADAAAVDADPEEQRHRSFQLGAMGQETAAACAAEKNRSPCD